MVGRPIIRRELSDNILTTTKTGSRGSDRPLIRREALEKILTIRKTGSRGSDRPIILKKKKGQWIKFFRLEKPSAHWSAIDQ